MCTRETSKLEFITFLTNEEKSIMYNGKQFTKTMNGNIIVIQADGELVYKVHKEKKLLIVIKALYMTFLKDEYWGVAKEAGLKEVIADPHTLIRV